MLWVYESSIQNLNQWMGISLNGRVPALHVGGTGIDTLILHVLFVFDVYAFI